MRHHYRAVLAVCVLASSMACQHGAGSDRIGSDKQIDSTQASALALRRFDQLFSDKYILNPLEHRHFRIPTLAQTQVTSVELVGSVWVVRVEPPAGLSMEARVARDGSWTELLRVTWSAQ